MDAYCWSYPVPRSFNGRAHDSCGWEVSTNSFGTKVLNTSKGPRHRKVCFLWILKEGNELFDPHIAWSNSPQVFRTSDICADPMQESPFGLQDCCHREETVYGPSPVKTRDFQRYESHLARANFKAHSYEHIPFKGRQPTQPHPKSCSEIGCANCAFYLGGWLQQTQSQ